MAVEQRPPPKKTKKNNNKKQMNIYGKEREQPRNRLARVVILWRDIEVCKLRFNGNAYLARILPTIVNSININFVMITSGHRYS